LASPESKPVRNQRVRCSLEPCVKVSGLIRPCAACWIRSSPRRGGAERLLGVARLEVLALVDAVGPDPGQAVGLELEPHRERVGLVGALPGALAHLLLDAEEALDVVADLVGDDVGLGEVAGRAKARPQLREEAEVEVDALVGRAVEGAGRRRGRTARGVDRAREDHELGVPVLLARLRERLLPRALDVVEDVGRELEGLVLGRRALQAAGARRGGREAAGDRRQLGLD